MSIEQIAVNIKDAHGLDMSDEAAITLLRQALSKLAKPGVEPVAWMNSRNGFIAKENKNPEYNVGLYTCPPAPVSDIAKDNNTFAASWQLYDAERMTSESLRQQLAASQAREQQLQQILRHPFINWIWHQNQETYTPKETDFPQHESGVFLDDVTEALAIPTDTTALQAMITKAGEVMRERCAEQEGLCQWSSDMLGLIRALPPITLDDLKGSEA